MLFFGTGESQCAFGRRKAGCGVQRRRDARLFVTESPGVDVLALASRQPEGSKTDQADRAKSRSVCRGLYVGFLAVSSKDELGFEARQILRDQRAVLANAKTDTSLADDPGPEDRTKAVEVGQRAIGLNDRPLCILGAVFGSCDGLAVNPQDRD